MPGSIYAIDKVKVTITLTVIKHEGGNPCGIGPKRQDHHIHHQFYIFIMVSWNAWLRANQAVAQLTRLKHFGRATFSKLDTFLNGSDSIKILRNLVFVCSTYFTLKAFCVIHHQIDYTLVHTTITIAEHAIKDRARLYFTRTW